MSISRRAWIEVAILAFLAAIVVVLWLNHGELDEYPPGLDAAEAARPGDLPDWLPPVLAHPCVLCELCLHRFEETECRLAVTVIDRDGWYRLFWSGPETHVYDDAALVGGALRNRTAELAGGTWTIRGRYVPVLPSDPHPCPAAADSVDLRYRLRRGTYPGSDEPALDPSGTLVVPRRIRWFRYPFPLDREDDFWWELENPETFAGTVKEPCSCGTGR